MERSGGETGLRAEVLRSDSRSLARLPRYSPALTYFADSGPAVRFLYTSRYRTTGDLKCKHMELREHLSSRHESVRYNERWGGVECASSISPFAVSGAGYYKHMH